MPYAKVEQDQVKLPTLTPGELTPAVWKDWQLACMNFFRAKQVPDAEQVAKIAFQMRDPTMRQWYISEQVDIDAMTFVDYMRALSVNFMPKGWETKMRQQILSSHQNSRTFWEWSIELINKNALLHGSAYHISNEILHHHLEANMHPENLDDYEEDDIALIENFKDWREKVRSIDEKRTRVIKKFEDVIRANNARRSAEKQKAKQTTMTTTTTNKVLTTSSRANTDGKTGIDAAEKAILLKYRGCFKCLRFNVKHRSRDCPNQAPPANRKRLSEADVPASAKAAYAAFQRVKTETAAAIQALEEQENAASAGETSTSATAPMEVAAVMQTCVLEGADTDSDEYVAPFSAPHLVWNCLLEGPSTEFPTPIRALIDHGSHLVLIDEALVRKLGLRRRRVPTPIHVKMAVAQGTHELTEWVKIKPSTVNSSWTSRTLRAVIAPSLCSPLILGIPFLEKNKVVIDHELRTCVPKGTDIDLLHPPPADTKFKPARSKPLSPKAARIETIRAKKVALAQLLSKSGDRRETLDTNHTHSIKREQIIASIRDRIETLSKRDNLDRLEKDIRTEFADRFPTDLPPVDEVPSNVFHRFKLKDANKIIACRQYACPRKYREAWKKLIDDHLQAGRIRESSSAYASPAFLVPKKDPTVTPRWVNDYRQLNANTVPDSGPLPRIDDILNDCAKGRVWSKIDMTNSFFQTRVHPDDIPLTAVTTPFGLYEWVVMPMGCRNAPATHQCRMNHALRAYIGKICHVYLDDIIIWSDTVQENVRAVRLILQALRDNGLYASPKKTGLFKCEMDFLGHHLSERGIEADTSKVDKILNWPVPKTATQVRSFLGLVRYIAHFLPALAEHTVVLMPFTTKDAEKNFPGWGSDAQRAFEGIK